MTVMVASSPFAESPVPLSVPSPFAAGAQGLAGATGASEGSFEALADAFKPRDRRDRSRSPAEGAGAVTPVPTKEQEEAARLKRQAEEEARAQLVMATEAGS